MQELRWNPLLGTWTIVAANRQNRPHLPSDVNPFGPTNPKIPSNYTVLAYANDFPALSVNAPNVDTDSKLMNSKAAYGYCVVLLYTPDENARFYELTLGNIVELIKLWKDRDSIISKDPQIKYIHIFENRGEEVGVTIKHPHGQLYAYPFVPLKQQIEHTNCKRYFECNKRALLDDLLAEELTSAVRIIDQSGDWVAYIPYYTDFPYGIIIQCTRAISYIRDIDADMDVFPLARLLRNITAAYDALFNRTMPYIMSIHQGVINSPDFDDPSLYYRLRIEFYPYLRSESKLKYYAGSEMGAWAAANPKNVDECAVEMRRALSLWEKLQNSNG